jgi:hypothetical protein
MSPSGIDFSEAVTASGPSFRICSRSWPKRASDSCIAVAILFRSAATSALNAPPLEAEGEARLTMLGVRAGRRGNRSARIGRSRRSQSCRRTTRGQSHAVRTWSYLVDTRCSGSSTWRISWAVRELGRIRVAGQLELATTRTDIPLDPYVLHEFGVASPADPTDGLAGGPPFSGPRPGPILLPRANVAGLNIWGDDLHPWRCPSSLGSLTRIAPFRTTAWSRRYQICRSPRHPDAPHPSRSLIARLTWPRARQTRRRWPHRGDARPPSRLACCTRS